MKTAGAFLITALLMASFASGALAWDPSGTWGIEGRSDATLKISCSGDTCKCSFESAYGKFKATGYVRGNSLALVYNYLTPVDSNAFGFLVYERQGDARMTKKTFDLTGKLAGSDNWVRK